MRATIKRVVGLLPQEGDRRASMLALPGTLFNVAYSAMYAWMGWSQSSPWLGTLAAYYILLSILRVVVIHPTLHRAGEDEAAQARRGRRASVASSLVMLTMCAVIAGMTILMTLEKGGKTQSGIMIYAMATYTFVTVGSSIVSLARARRDRSLALRALRRIGLLNSLVSLHSLQFAMLVEFGKGDAYFQALMVSVTGVVLGVITFLMGVAGLVVAWRNREGGAA